MDDPRWMTRGWVEAIMIPLGSVTLLEALDCSPSSLNCAQIAPLEQPSAGMAASSSKRQRSR